MSIAFNIFSFEMINVSKIQDKEGNLEVSRKFFLVKFDLMCAE